MVPCRIESLGWSPVVNKSKINSRFSFVLTCFCYWMGKLGPMDMQLTLQPRYALFVEFSETLTVSIYNRRLDTKCSIRLVYLVFSKSSLVCKEPCGILIIQLQSVPKVSILMGKYAAKNLWPIPCSNINYSWHPELYFEIIHDLTPIVHTGK